VSFSAGDASAALTEKLIVREVGTINAVDVMRSFVYSAQLEASWYGPVLFFNAETLCGNVASYYHGAVCPFLLRLGI
jgi:hypothetical protein